MASYSEKKISAAECKLIIAKYPLFCLLNEKEIEELAQLAKEMDFTPGRAITQEGDLVDYVYLIVSGSATVTRMIKTVEKAIPLHVVTLSKDDAIGLSEMGFFSSRGVRTATVTAATPVVTLAFHINEFQQFFQRPGVTYPALKNAGEQILLMNFIRQSGLAAHLNNESICQLAKNIIKIKTPKGESLFKIGEPGDKCFFIISGQVMTISEAGEKNILEAPLILGNQEFLTQTPYKMSATAHTDCVFFVIDHESIQVKIIGTDQDKPGFLTKLKMQIKKMLG